MIEVTRLCHVPKVKLIVKWLLGNGKGQRLGQTVHTLSLHASDCTRNVTKLPIVKHDM